MTTTARWCSVCGVTGEAIGVLSIDFKVKKSNATQSESGSRYMCQQCANKVMAISIDAPAAPRPKEAA